MKQNILFLITLFILNSTVTLAADLQTPLDENSALDSATTAPVSHKTVKRPPPLEFPKSFGLASDSVLSKITLKISQVAISGKDTILQIFTHQNMDALKVFVISATLTCLWVTGEIITWTFGALNSLRKAVLAPKSATKTA
ncbi:hypothetical protein [Candidatus Bodocaedibacter vickermanii]|uniref:Uncharacterized protein n=1 Tax=Candidatus Bodocaedibacter vickermanii TaxID=2741701 RepID=A0A7L9RS34_9PROT|nr:hypothetical protein CPBP_00175 [Candidatus Paracaedibacteraceae bacterium 'Lake Konstanz']